MEPAGPTASTGALATAPGSTDDVTISSTFSTINHSGTDTVNSLTLLGGTLANSGSLTASASLTLGSAFATISNGGTLTADGTFTWTSGTLSGTGDTVLNGTSSLSGGFFSMLTDQQVDNHGTASITDGNSIDFRGNAVWNNDVGSTFVLQGSGTVANFFPGPSAAFNNDGTLDVTARRQSREYRGAHGGVQQQRNRGRARWHTQPGAGGTGGGTFTVETGAALTAGNYTLNNATVNDAGTFQVGTFNNLTVAGPSTIENLTINGGTVTVNADLEVQNLTLSGGTLTGPANVTIDNTFTWTGGSLSGTGDTILDGTSTLTGSFFSALGRQIDNYGTATVVDGTSLSFQSNAIWNNEVGSTFILPGSAGISQFFSTSSAFNNAGTVEKTAPAGTSTIGILFNNTGSVDVQAGTLSLTGGGTGGGTFTVETGAALAAGNYTLNNATVNDAGTFQVGTFNNLTVAGPSTIENLTINGGTVTVNADLEVQNLTLSGGTLTGPANVTIDNTFTWTGGSLSGTGDTILDGSSTLTGSFFSRWGGRLTTTARRRWWTVRRSVFRATRSGITRSAVRSSCPIPRGSLSSSRPAQHSTMRARWRRRRRPGLPRLAFCSTTAGLWTCRRGH